MSGAIHALWDSPEGTDLQKQTHRYMMQTLKDLQWRLPGVLTDPEQAGGAKVMEAAMAATLNPKVPEELRRAMLAMLQGRMKQVDPSTPQRQFPPRAEHRSAISEHFGDELVALGAFEQAVEAFVLARRPVAAALASPDPSDVSDAVGVLVALLITRLGLCSPALLGKAIQALGCTPWVAGPWAWVDVDLSDPSRGTAQLRRLFLDPITLAAWIRASQYAPSFPKPREGQKAGKRTLFYRAMARNAVWGLCKKLAAAAGEPLAIRSLTALCHAQAQRIHLTTMPLLATYAQGDIASSSLEIGTWLRLIGYQAPPQCQKGESPIGGADQTYGEGDDAAGQTLVLDGIDPGGDSSLLEQIERGDLEEHGLVANLRMAMAGPRPTWREQLEALIDELHAQGPEQQTARYVVCWLHYLAFKREAKGHVLGDGTVQNYRGMLGNRLLQHLPSPLSEVDAEELQDAYLDVIMSRRSLEQTGRIKAALVSFDRYVRNEHLPDLPEVELPGFETGSYAISSRIIVEHEFQRGLHLISQGEMAFNDPELARQTEAFWVLAYRFGLRRREILGLQVRDLDEHIVRIRRNDARKLKTSNAHRLVPMHVLAPQERHRVLRLAEGRALADFVFFGETVPTARLFDAHPVIPKINDLLERVTGDRRLHPHNLRHSTATLTLLGSLGGDLDLADHPYAPQWMKSSLGTGARVEQAVSGELHRKGARGSALAVLMGHGSELTTYEHYVHSLDLLLFLACWSGRFNDRASARLGPTRKNNALLVAMLGYAPSTRVDATDIPALLRRMCDRYPGSLTRLEPAENHPHTRVPSAQTDTALQPWTLQQLRDLPGASNWRGFPSTQAELDSVHLLLRQLSRIEADDRPRLRSMLARWMDAQIKNSDWASMTPDAARRWVEELAELDPGINLEAMHVSQEHRNKKLKVPVAAPEDSSSYVEQDGRYWVRIADRRPKVDGRKRQTARRRSRTQECISWLLRALTIIDDHECSDEIEHSCSAATDVESPDFIRISKVSSAVMGGFFRRRRCAFTAAHTAPGLRSKRWRTN